MVKIYGEYITLGQLLKKEDFISSGSEAKIFLLENNIKVNNIVEARRGKKLYAGDVVEINDKTLVIENENWVNKFIKF